MRQPYKNIMEARERRIAEARSLTLFSDTFMSVALKDPAACQHVLRILTGIRDLTVKEIRIQYRISKITSHDAILDILAEDSKGRMYNIEIQRKDTVDHARRTRFYSSMIDSESLAKGKTYSEMPDVYIIYISETDLWKAGKTVYPVQKSFAGTKIPYEDGVHILYVTAAVDDGSDTAKLMKYFKTSDPADMSQGDLSKRVHFLKQEEGGYQIMCDISEKWFLEGKEDGREEGRIEGLKAGRQEGREEGLKAGRQEGKEEGFIQQAKKTAYNMANAGISVEKIASFVDFNIDTVKKWLSEQPSPVS